MALKVQQVSSGEHFTWHLQSSNGINFLTDQMSIRLASHNPSLVPTWCVGASTLAMQCCGLDILMQSSRECCKAKMNKGVSLVSASRTFGTLADPVRIRGRPSVMSNEGTTNAVVQAKYRTLSGFLGTIGKTSVKKKALLMRWSHMLNSVRRLGLLEQLRRHQT